MSLCVWFMISAVDHSLVTIYNLLLIQPSGVSMNILKTPITIFQSATVEINPLSDNAILLLLKSSFKIKSSYVTLFFHLLLFIHNSASQKHCSCILPCSQIAKPHLSHLGMSCNQSCRGMWSGFSCCIIRLPFYSKTCFGYATYTQNKLAESKHNRFTECCSQ